MQQSVEEQAYTEARRVLRSLLLGIDPETHTQLSPECVVMQAEVKTALALGADALKDTQWVQRWREKRRDKSSESNVRQRTRTSPELSSTLRQELEHAGRGWSKQEDVRLTSAFYRSRPLHAIAAAHGRTDRAIEARLVRLGLVANMREMRSVS